MANSHGCVNTTLCSCWDVDAMKIAGIYTADVDNGVFVTLGDMNLDSSNVIQGYEYNVALANNASTHCYMIRTPEVGSSIEMQMMSDPRYFYNEAGRPLSLCWIAPHVDHIEVDANCFVGGSLPAKGAYVGIGTGGKLVALEQAPSTDVTYFLCVGLHDMDAGQALIPTAVLRCENN